MTSTETDTALVTELTERLVAPVAAWRPGATVRELRPLTGGTSSLTFLARLDGVPDDRETIVLKVAPPGLEPTRNRDVLRQARLQAALQRDGRPLAPEVLFTDAGAPPAVPPFMAMNLVPGECVEPVLRPASDRPAPDVVRARYLAAARALADLHAVRPDEVGLGDEPVVDLTAEIGRWTRAFETLPLEMQGDYRGAAAALLDSVPVALTPVINHGDYRLGNTLCDGERLTAIIDWEIWSIGDPRVDLTWLTFFTDDAAHPAAEPGESVGTPTRDEVVAAYVEARGDDVPDLVWFHALTSYKEAAATGLLLKRAARNGTPISGALARMESKLPGLVQETLRLLGR